MQSESGLVREQLTSKFPKLFAPKGKQKVPLKVGVHKDIHEKCPDLDLETIRSALGDYTGGPTYLNNVKLGEPRFDLDGQASGIVEERDVNFAHQRLRSLRRKWQKQRGPKQRTVTRQAAE